MILDCALCKMGMNRRLIKGKWWHITRYNGEPYQICDVQKMIEHKKVPSR